LATTVVFLHVNFRREKKRISVIISSFYKEIREIKHFINKLMHNIEYADRIEITKKCSNMFRIAQDPSSRRPVQCLVKNYKNDSIVSVDMDMISVMAVL
jgi:hypothetical protein